MIPFFLALASFFTPDGPGIPYPILPGGGGGVGGGGYPGGCEPNSNLSYKSCPVT
ncbi:MAG: hypothetical protein WBQ94_03755 [Terracidiphilus sp.]